MASNSADSDHPSSSVVLYSGYTNFLKLSFMAENSADPNHPSPSVVLHSDYIQFSEALF